jgi:hypothetical protein
MKQKIKRVEVITAIPIPELKLAIHRVGKRIGINTVGKEWGRGYKKDSAACWQCALLEELKL